jgi:hypothetical protein
VLNPIGFQPDLRILRSFTVLRRFRASRSTAPAAQDDKITKSTDPAETSHEILRTKTASFARRSTTAENGENLLRFSATKPAVSPRKELLYFRNLCSVMPGFSARIYCFHY